MADLLKSLARPSYEIAHHNSSQESFHSAGEMAAEAHPTSHQTLEEMVHEIQKQIGPSNDPKTADSPHQDRSHESYDINAYLSDPANAALLNSAMTKPQTGYYVSLLYQICQTKGLTPLFEIEGVSGSAIFSGVLRVGDITVTLNDACRSKKEARERLAERAIEPVKASQFRIPINPTLVAADEADKDQNWIGMVQGMSTTSSQPPTQTPPSPPPTPNTQPQTKTSFFPTRIPRHHPPPPHALPPLRLLSPRHPILRLHPHPPLHPHPHLRLPNNPLPLQKARPPLRRKANHCPPNLHLRPQPRRKRQEIQKGQQQQQQSPPFPLLLLHHRQRQRQQHLQHQHRHHHHQHPPPRPNTPPPNPPLLPHQIHPLPPRFDTQNATPRRNHPVAQSARAAVRVGSRLGARTEFAERVG